MNGWERLGFVIATVIALPTAAITFDATKTIRVYIRNGSEFATMSGQPAINMAYQLALQKPGSEIDECPMSAVNVRPPSGDYDNDWDLTCDRTPMGRLGKAVQYGIIPYLVIWGIGLTFAWIRAGFRRKAV